MIGSDTFIIVALRCTENSTPSALAAASWAARNSSRARADSTVASTTSPAMTGSGRSQRGDGAVGGHELDAELGGLGDGDRLLVGAEVVGAHGGHVGLRVGRPGTHRVRVAAGVALHRGGGPAIGVALAQHRVDGAALHLVVAGLGVALGVGGRVVGVVGDGVALGLELLDGRLELRRGGRHVGQLDDVGLGRGDEGAELGEVVGDALLGGERVGERGQDAPGERDVAGLDVDVGGGGEGGDDGQQRVRGQRRCLVGQRVDDRARVVSVMVSNPTGGGSAARSRAGQASPAPARPCFQ